MNVRKAAGGNAAKKKDDGAIDQEQQFILRLPPGPAMALKHDVYAGQMSLKDKLSIELPADSRHGKVTYGGYVFNSKLVDLPCIIESLKTTDRKTFYKTADICQMLICTNDDVDEIIPPTAPVIDNSLKKKEKDKRYLWNHGICPPLKNVRKKRFRKVLQKKYQEQPDIEKEVKRLFHTDSTAMDVKWEIIVDEEKSHEPGGPSTSGARDDLYERIPTKSDNLELDIFGDVSSSDEDEDEDLMDVKPNMAADDYDEHNSKSLSSRILDDDDMKHILGGDSNLEEEMKQAQEDLGFTMNDGDDSDIPDLRNRLRDLDSDLNVLNQKRVQMEMEVSILDDSSDKTKMEQELAGIIAEEKSKRYDYEMLSSVLS